MNKLQLEGLTKSGTFDEFDNDRNKIFQSIPKIIQQIKNNNEDRENNQTNLFEKSNDYLNEFEFLPSVQWKQKELLQEEFKSLGFYISNHPLNEYEEISAKEEKKCIIISPKFVELDEAGNIKTLRDKIRNSGITIKI